MNIHECSSEAFMCMFLYQCRLSGLLVFFPFHLKSSSWSWINSSGCLSAPLWASETQSYPKTLFPTSIRHRSLLVFCKNYSSILRQLHFLYSNTTRFSTHGWLFCWFGQCGISHKENKTFSWTRLQQQIYLIIMLLNISDLNFISHDCDLVSQIYDLISQILT